MGRGWSVYKNLFYITHSAFNFYWPGGIRFDARVLTAVKKELVNKIMVENKTDLVDHPYFLALDIRDMDSRLNKPARRTRVVNAYDNRVGQGGTWEGNTPRNRRVLDDIIWDRVILGDMNAHSPVWNSHCQRRKIAKPLEDIIEKFDLLINNGSMAELGFLTLWEIPKD